ncbi:glycoside hydrolase family 3 protein [Tunturiibacter lichenicola]|uniref:glycoside hydrolase family 3 protein n=1 Tax=Tunturiibacter lichenicola TaxID=2051959 RepID=UPI0021B4028F|nr:glycoside hydrolase family 3 N-terminal domain-containing protein [Edaphobacter lichenicola]
MHAYRFVLALSAFAVTAGAQSTSPTTPQPAFGYRTDALLTVDGLEFKDMNHNGKLDPYEDWRLSPETRAADLVARMRIEDVAGLMVHGTLPAAGDLGRGNAYDLDRIRGLVVEQRVNSFITRLSTDARTLAAQNNHVQEIAEKSAFGVPVTISTDPRSHFQEVLGASSSDAVFSLWPEPLGFASIGDPAVVRQFADTVRQEYLAVGIRESLAPQADLVTEPRWARSNGTFGSNAKLAKRLVEGYVAGMQNGEDGLNHNSVLTVVKHWAGYGAEKDGWDAHNFYGRYASFEDDHLAYHLIPFEGAFHAHVAAVMPTYAILQGASLNGKPLEQVGANFNTQLITGLLRGHYAFSGVVLSDWGITSDCNENCQNGAPNGTKPSPKDIGMPWGVESLTKPQRFAKAINAGVDQIGGTEEAALIVEDIRSGLISEVRAREAATRILVQKFQLGLFEQPYADEGSAQSVVGKPEFVQAGQAAQASAVVLLKNALAPAPRKPLLPLTKTGLKVYLYGLRPESAKAAGWQVVSDPSQAEVAIIRAPAPFQGEHPGYFFGSRQHEGRLNFLPTDPAFAELLKASSTTPCIFITTLERPLILTDVMPHATAVLGDFGIDDKPLLDLLKGTTAPSGHLPFELPSSAEAVEQQKSDLPDDSAQPLFPRGFGMHF